MQKGIDISHFQGKIDWNKVKQDFVFMKATQGIGYVDPTLRTNTKGARSTGARIGFYHFADKKRGSAAEQARHFVKTVKPLLLDEDFLILDWEIEHDDAREWCVKFCDEVSKHTPNQVIIYTNDARAKELRFDELGYTAWVARYGANTGEPDREPDAAWDIWQYTSRGKVDGIKGNVDLNHSKLSMNVNIEKDDDMHSSGEGLKIEKPPETTCKHWYHSKTLYIAVLQEILAIVSLSSGQEEVGYTLVVTGIIQAALRLLTKKELV